MRPASRLSSACWAFFVRIMKDRAAFFIDGNNFYYSMLKKDIPRRKINRINYMKLCQKLAGDREVVYVGYFVGKLANDAPNYGEQRAFFSRLEKSGVNLITGRIEQRPAGDNLNRKVDDLLEWLRKNIGERNLLETPMYNLLRQQCLELRGTTIWAEKAVDVQLAVSLVSMAVDDYYDTAYILSADGDYTPAVEKVKSIGKNVLGVSYGYGHELSQALGDKKFIRLKKASFISSCIEE